MLDLKKIIPTILISSVTVTFGCRGTGTNTSTVKDIVGIENFACNSPAPESPGQHNMILFGSPDDATYAYHLPLFAGSTNGTTGHVLMHVYQGLWNVTLDSKTQPKYLEAFNRLSTVEHPIPMFSFSPQKKRFKVPEMICTPNFSFPANVVSGHVEGNPDFPAPAPLINENSQITTNGAAMFGRRFDKSSKSEITFLLFGTQKQQFMVHFLTDDESSFDQIVSINIEDQDLKNEIEQKKIFLVTIADNNDPILEAIPDLATNASLNNKFKINPLKIGQSLGIHEKSLNRNVNVTLQSEIYFNKNSDLQK